MQRYNDLTIQVNMGETARVKQKDKQKHRYEHADIDGYIDG